MIQAMASKNFVRLHRRTFLRTASVAVAGLAASPLLGANRKAQKLHLSTNAYSWHVFYQREGRDFNASLESGFRDVANSGIDGYEPGISSVDDVKRLAPALRAQGLELRSIYVNSSLHEPVEADRSIELILSVAREAKPLGTRIVVTNPNPIRWGGPDNKSDTQLRTQAIAMNRLGHELGKLGITLAYHNHDIELRQSAREFHHMMAGTDPSHVGLCLDAHWVYRGTGNSNVALLDIVELYGSRVKELHLRQSENGIWSETLGPGDVNYEALVQALVRKKVKPHLVLEVAVEKGTPKTLDPVTAHRRSVEYARRVFAPLA